MAKHVGLQLNIVFNRYDPAIEMPVSCSLAVTIANMPVPSISRAITHGTSLSNATMCVTNCCRMT